MRADGTGIDPGLALLHRIIVQQIAGFKVVRGIQHEIRAGEQFVNIRGNQVGNVRLHLHLAVEAGDLPPRGFRLGQGVQGIGFVEQHLPLQVAPLHIVAIDQGESTDPGARQKACGGSPGCPHADNGDPRFP